MLLPMRLGAAVRPDRSVVAPTGVEPLRVLVVDDNRDSADTMVQVLQLLGHEARAAYGAEQACAEGPAFAPRLVLLDLNMPDGSGYEVMRELRDEVSPPPYIAAMTGYGQRSDRESTLGAGFHAHITKPVGPDELQRVLAAAAGSGSRASIPNCR
jgi:CheY-like chemotaxis protein